MVPLHVLTLVVSGPQQPSILVLQPNEETPSGKSRVVPIWIGAAEAAQLGVALEHVRLPRPMTHDLFLDALTNLDARVDHVYITGCKGATFFAKLVLRQGNRMIELDARPSDALSLAIRQDAPFFIDEDVLERASFPYVFRTEASDDVQLEEFKTFLEGITPDDFANDV